MDNRQPEAQVVRDLTIAGFDQKAVSNVPFVLVPEGFVVHSLDYMLPEPNRKRGQTVMNDAASFVDYFNAHKAENSHVYGTVNPPQFVGVLNDDGKTPGWGDHRVQYSCPFSPEWKAWTNFSGHPRNQIEFSEFIEAHVPDIVSSAADEPSGGDMLQVATSFKAQKKVNFASAQRLDNGQVDFVFQEEIQGSAGPKGQIKVPERFFIGVPVFEGGAPYKVEAKLRYRLKDGQLLMWFELVRAEKVVEAAFMDVWRQIEEESATKIWRGTPVPMPPVRK